MKEKTYMRIGELERRSGIPRSTIHFYLRRGVLHSPIKTGKTMAYYDESHLERLLMIQKMKMDMRMPIAFIKKQLTSAKRSETPNGNSGSLVSDSALSTLSPKEKRKHEIIKAAIEVFSVKGYHKTKIQDITDAIGISTGTFYIYFSNKKELFIEVIDDVVRIIIGSAASAIKGEQDFGKRLTIRGRVFFENYTRYNEILYQLRAEMASEDEWAQEKVKKIYHELTKPLIREIEMAIQRGEIRPVDPDLLAYALTGLTEIMSLRTTIGSRYSFLDIMEFIRDLVQNGLDPL